MLTTKIIHERVANHILSPLKIALHKVTITKINFHPSGLFENCWLGARTFLTVEREEASISPAANLATTIADMFVELYCLKRPILVFIEVLEKALVFCCIRFIQSKCSHCRPSLFNVAKW